jgi:hypothetical protein
MVNGYTKGIKKPQNKRNIKRERDIKREFPEKGRLEDKKDFLRRQTIL